MKSKKLIPIIISAALILTACQKSDPNINFYEYEDILSETGEAIGVKIIACSLSNEEIRVPKTLDGKTVLKIGMKKISEGNYIGAFEGCPADVKRIILPEGLTYIGQQTFGECSSLKKLKLPSTVTDIDVYAFTGCTALEEITLPEGLLSIESMAFDCCDSLTDVTVPYTVEKIGRDAFNGCFDIVVHYRGLD